MKQLFLILLVCLSLLSKSYGQLNVELLHQLVAESKEEYARQNMAKNKQALVSANEESNKNQLTKLKTKYRELKNRFNRLGIAIDAVQIGIEASPIVSAIIDQQSIIYAQASSNPILMVLAIEAEKDLSDRAHLLINYLYGLTLSIGDLNQMKASDRKILFSHVLTELRSIAGASRGLALSMIQANRKSSLNPFASFINEDKRLVEEIMRNNVILKR